MSDTSKFNSLEALAVLYADLAAHGGAETFGDYIDNRYEDTFDIISRGVIKSYQKTILGSADPIEGIVLRTTPRPYSWPTLNVRRDAAAGAAAGSINKELTILRNLGLNGVVNLASARILVLKTRHTAILPKPGSYDGTLADMAIIDQYPEFVYSPDTFPLVPGSWIDGQFNKNTYRAGVITQLQPKAPYVMAPVSSEKKADLFNGSSPDLGSTTAAAELNPVSEVPQEDPPWPFPFNPSVKGWNGYMLVSSPYAHRNINKGDGKGIVSELHPALDVGCPTGTPYIALADGVVVTARFHEKAGNYVDIRYKDPRPEYSGYAYIRYLHMKEPASVQVTDSVSKGQVVGYSGNTGASTSPHLHLDARVVPKYTKSALINPARFWPSSYFRRREGTYGDYSVGAPIAANPAGISTSLYSSGNQ